MRTAAQTAAAHASRLLRLDPDDAVVMVVDAQNDFCHPDGKHARMGKDVGRLQAPLHRLHDFLGVARRYEVPVVFVQNLHDEEDDSPAWRQRHLDPDRPPTCVAGTWGADFCHIAPLDGDTVVRKHRYSVFARTEIEQVLTTLRRTSLLFTGFTTGVCVESSLREAVCRDYLATLVEDCCGDHSRAAHDGAVTAVANGFALVVRSDEISHHWSKTAQAGDRTPQSPKSAPDVLEA